MFFRNTIFVYLNMLSVIGIIIRSCPKERCGVGMLVMAATRTTTTAFVVKPTKTRNHYAQVLVQVRHNQHRLYSSRLLHSNMVDKDKLSLMMSATTGRDDNDNNNNNINESNLKDTTKGTTGTGTTTTTSTTSTSTATTGNTNTDTGTSIYANKNNINDQVVSAISGAGGVKVTACTIRNLVNDLMLQHMLTPIPTQALGRTICCGLLMSNGIQDEQNVQISIRTEDGPLRGIVTVVTGLGEVRGYVGTPMLGKGWTLEDAVGKIGSVQIVKNHPSWPRPYNGITAVRYGDVDRDIGIYLAESEQRSCALAAACAIQDDILCSAAGGYLIELLPDCTPYEKEQVEQNLSKLVELDGSKKLPTGLLSQGKTPYDICTLLLNGLEMQPLQSIEPRIKCPCTEERLLRSLRLLPTAEVEDILITEGKVEARCDFCGKVYRMTPDEVRTKMAAAAAINADPSILKDDATGNTNADIDTTSTDGDNNSR